MRALPSLNNSYTQFHTVITEAQIAFHTRHKKKINKQTQFSFRWGLPLHYEILCFGSNGTIFGSAYESAADAQIAEWWKSWNSIHKTVKPSQQLLVCQAKNRVIAQFWCIMCRNKAKKITHWWWYSRWKLQKCIYYPFIVIIKKHHN